jgi:hypothetical protein
VREEIGSTKAGQVFPFIMGKWEGRVESTWLNGHGDEKWVRKNSQDLGLDAWEDSGFINSNRKL